MRQSLLGFGSIAAVPDGRLWLDLGQESSQDLNATTRRRP